MYSCLYYNLYAAASTTTQGRSCNSAIALFFESFLSNNVPMGSMNELMEFIHNVLVEERIYDSKNIIDIHASIEETFFQLMASTGFGWVPSEDEMYMVWEVLCKLDQDDLDRLFYKNNLFHFVDNAVIKTLIISMLQKLESPFMDPNEPPEEIKEDIDKFTSILYEYVYYHHQIIDRLEKMDALVRSVSIIQDTDSAIISVDGWYRYILRDCANMPMKIKTIDTDVAALIDGEVKTTPTKQKVMEYSFLDDDIIEVEKMVDPTVIIPQDGLRYSIINILAYVLGVCANDYMRRYCDNFNTTNARPCLITAKNEFLFSRVLITEAKKQYASKMELQEGNIVPEEKSLDIKGMDAMKKSTRNPVVQEKLKKVMYEDILCSQQIDPVEVLRHIAQIEKEIYNSIQAGEKTYYKPVKVKSLAAYENPMRIQGINASYAYNALHEPGTEAIDLNARNSVDIVKVDISTKTVDKIKNTFPDVYERAVELLKTKEYRGGISSIAIPPNEVVPEWVLPFVEYEVIINDNVTGFPLESIGLFRGNKTNNSTNIIHF